MEIYSSRDIIQTWFEDNGYYELARRIAFIPDEIIEKLWFETPLAADQMLKDNGY